MMKECSRCHIEKDESEFYIDSRKKTGSDRYRSICKTCWCERKKAYCKANKEKIAESDKLYRIKNRGRQNERAKRWRTENADRVKERNSKRLINGHAFLNSMKTPCRKCGETRLHVIHFHHIDPAKKSFNIGVSKASRIDTDSLIPEIKKCICLCANCHQEFHYFYGYKPRNPAEALKEYLGVDEIDW
jgi:hypothetical protein